MEYERIVADMYRNNYAYHHVHWLQSDLSTSFLKQHGLSSEDATLFERSTNKCRFLNIEVVWPSLSIEIQNSLASIIYVPSLTTNVSEIGEVIAQLTAFTALTLQQRTNLLNQSHPHLKSGGEFPHHLFTVKLGDNHSAFMIGKMDMTNWRQWVALLQRNAKS